MGHSGGMHVSPQARERPWKIHPIWRGLGCVMMLIIPIMSYAGASILIELNQDQGWGFPVPRELTRTQTINIPIPIPGIPDVYFEVEHLLGNLVLGVLLMLVGFGLLMVLYAILYRVLGPPRFGPLDAEPVRRKPKEKKKDWRDRDVSYRR